MKRLITLAFVLVSLTASAWEVPKHYLPPLKPAFSAPFIKAKKPMSTIWIINCQFASPCDGSVITNIQCVPSTSPRQFALTVAYSLGGPVLYRQSIYTAPANISYIGVIERGVSAYCQETIVTYYVGWYNPQW